MPHRWGHRPSWGGESAQQEPSKEKTGDPFIDQWIDQGGSWSIGADGSLILYKAGDRRSDPILQRIPNYFPDSEGGGGGYPPAHLDPKIPLRSQFGIRLRGHVAHSEFLVEFVECGYPEAS